MSLFHGQEETRRVRVGNGKVYLQPRKYCVSHGWIDLVSCDGRSNWETRHDGCEAAERSHNIHLRSTPKKAA